MAGARFVNHNLKESEQMRLAGCVLVLSAVILAGCTTSSPQAGAANQMRLKSDIENLHQETLSINGRLEALEVLQAEVRKNQFEMRESGRESAGTLSTRMLELEGQVKALETARQKDRDEIIRTLTEKILQVMDEGRRTAVRPGVGSEYAYEHVVQKGDTVSGIASQYKTTVEAIVRENNLRNPNAIREGQKLYIPR